VLAAAAGEVAEQVIQDNRDQVLLLSLEQVRSRTQVSAFRDHLTAIEQRGTLRRHEQALPTREALAVRRSRFPGLTRPELSVLTAYTKIDLTHRIEETAMLDDPYLVDRFLTPYFPVSIAQRFGAEIPGHRLRRELIATRMVNEMVDLTGSTFIFALVRDYGVEAQDAVRAWLVANDILGIRERVRRLKTGANELSVEAELGAFLALARAVDRASRWAIAEADSSDSIGAIVGRYQPELEQLTAQFEAMLAADERDRFERTYRELRAAVHQEEIAYDLARLAFADHLLSAIGLSLRLKIEPARAAAVYFRLGEYLDFDLLETATEAITIAAQDSWERRAARELCAELRATRLELSRSIQTDYGEIADVGEAVGRGIRRREKAFEEARRLAAELRTLGSPGLAALEVA
jgi:glutamate dehydrogenase